MHRYVDTEFARAWHDNFSGSVILLDLTIRKEQKIHPEFALPKYSRTSIYPSRSLSPTRPTSPVITGFPAKVSVVAAIISGLVLGANPLKLVRETHAR